MDQLAGLVIVDVGRGAAAPSCGSYLARLGATVHRLRPPDDWLVDLDDGPQSIGRCTADALDHGKSCVDSNSLSDHARQVRRALATADVLVCDWTPAREAQLGLRIEDLRSQYPQLVVVAVTSYGRSGPDAERPGSELTDYHAGGEGYLLPGGLIHRAVPHRAPVRAGWFVADHDAGMAAAMGVVTALVARTSSDRGDEIDVSVVEVEMGLNRTTLTRAWFEGVDFDRTYEGYDYAGVLRCLDGWICLRPSEERHWSSFCEVIERPELATDPRFATRAARFENQDALNDALESWTRTVHRSVVRDAINAAGCPGGPYLEPHEVLEDPAINSRDLWSPAATGGVFPARLYAAVEAVASGEAVGERLSPSAAGPLAGLRVLDLSWVAAGPYASLLLAMAGAEVVKVESYRQPDLFRRSLNPEEGPDANIRFIDLNQGKRSLCLDLKSDVGREAVLRLASECDVVLENFRPGVRDRLGLSDTELRSRNPNLVAVSLSGFGATATDASRPGYASIFSAEAGLSAMTGWPDCSPADIRDTNDLRAGTLAALAAVAGLWSLRDSGRTWSCDVAARDALIALQPGVFLQASRGGRPTRAGNALGRAVPHGVFKSSDDRWVAIAVRSDHEWVGLTGAVPGLTQVRAAERFDDRRHVEEIVSRWIGERPADHVIRTLSGSGVPVAGSATAGDLRTDPHLARRQGVRVLVHPVMGELAVVGPPVRFASAPVGPAAASPPLLGEHDWTVLSDLGLSTQEIQAVVLAAGRPGTI